jgi:hypothetical protein
MVIAYALFAAGLLFCFMIFGEVITYKRWAREYDKPKAKIIYVDAYRGKDTNEDPSNPNTPLKTLKAAMARANDGDTVNVIKYEYSLPLSIEVVLQPSLVETPQHEDLSKTG